MSKERLQNEIDALRSIIKSDGQAYEKLKDENETLSSALHDAQHEIRILKNKIKRQKQTLEFYADETIYDAQYKLEIMRDGGERARKELIGS